MYIKPDLIKYIIELRRNVEQELVKVHDTFTNYSTKK